MPALRATGHAATAAVLLALPMILIGGGCERGSRPPSSIPVGAGTTPEHAYDVCAPCHARSGLGLPKAYPSLVGTSWVTGDAEVAIKVTLHGLRGPILVNGQSWNAMMMPFSHLPDAQIAAALTFARTSWGNAASPVSVEEVARVRAEHAGRTTPWTAAELGHPR